MCLSPHPDSRLLVSEQFWGRGVMTEALTAVTDFCFDNFPLRRISAEVSATNRASARVLEKAGFIFEGRLKNNVLKDGHLLDSPVYAPGKVAPHEPATCL
ncbi:MAG: GNAT family N-acetyltransferase [Candidatus Udaeobacter sp.]